MTTASRIAAPATLLTTAAISFSSAALAHHSFAMFDNSKTMVVEGVVREFTWANPHGSILLVTTKNGQQAEYHVELSGLNVMSRHGWTRNSLKAGDHVKVTVHPLKDGTMGGSFAGAVKADGTVLQSPAPQ